VFPGGCVADLHQRHSAVLLEIPQKGIQHPLGELIARADGLSRVAG
jgi:hypothetical protein